MAESAKDDNALNCQLQLKSPADKVSDIFRNKCDLFQTIMPRDVKKATETSANVWVWTFVKVVECGSWSYTVEPSEDTKPITWTLLEGEVPQKLYYNLKVVYHFSPNTEGCMASAKLYFDKKNANVPDPDGYTAFILKMFQAVDEYLLKH